MEPILALELLYRAIAAIFCPTLRQAQGAKGYSLYPAQVQLWGVLFSFVVANQHMPVRRGWAKYGLMVIK